ncbi:bifunctional folylpolyglutamate synthase/dihydrofolate synthase [Humibacter sp. BT305]|nr:bifunctional folylpolyglutamate synthase/dihydrofolate synthase [Humibacter sp. BT305]
MSDHGFDDNEDEQPNPEETGPEEIGPDDLEELDPEELAELAEEREAERVAARLEEAGEDAPDEFVDEGDAVYDALLARLGEAAPQPRLHATRRAVELLGDPHRAYPIIHITGTNGKTSTSRIAESLLRALGLRTGLFTSPHLVRVNERVVIDGKPISNEALASNWRDVEPFLAIVDGELVAAGEPPLTYFEALTVLAYASFAEAPVDVAVIEVGMGGEWDSTNVADGQVAVFTPISLDHTDRLGTTVAEIARTKSGIVKPAAQVVSAAQHPDALAELRRAAELTESTFALEGDRFALEESSVAVGGQLVSIRGLAGRYDEVFLPLYGTHQGHNAAVAVAAVESFLGGGSQRLADDVIAEGLGQVTSPGRLQLVGTEPTVLVDAAHNPGGAEALAQAVGEYFTFGRVIVVLAVLQGKDVEGIVRALDPIAAEFVITSSASERAIDPDELAAAVVRIVGADRVSVQPDLESALDEARDLADDAEQGAVLVTGSITLVGDAISIAERGGWKP